MTRQEHLLVAPNFSRWGLSPARSSGAPQRQDKAMNTQSNATCGESVWSCTSCWPCSLHSSKWMKSSLQNKFNNVITTPYLRNASTSTPKSLLSSSSHSSLSTPTRGRLPPKPLIHLGYRRIWKRRQLSLAKWSTYPRRRQVWSQVTSMTIQTKSQNYWSVALRITSLLKREDRQRLQHRRSLPRTWAIFSL